MRLKNQLILLCSLLFLSEAGCQLDQGSAARNEGAAIREMQIQPIFPPREDVQVGDVYYNPDPEGAFFAKGNGYIPIGLLVQAINLHKELGQYYNWRLSFPPTTNATTQKVSDLQDNPNLLIPQITSTGNIFDSGHDVTRLRLVGFPTFSTTTNSLGQISGVIPTEAFTAAFAAATASQKTVSFSAPVAEMYELPMPVVMAAWDLHASGDLQSVTSKARFRTTFDIITRYLGTPQYDKNGQLISVSKVPVTIITGVYYARAIDISVTAQSGAGLGLQARLNSAKLPAVIAPGTQTPTTRPTTAPATYSDYLNSTIDSSMAGTVPGGQAKFIYADDQTVVLRRTFERPMAIGYRGVTVYIEPTSRSIDPDLK